MYTVIESSESTVHVCTTMIKEAVCSEPAKNYRFMM
jgi:hypothetical protein